MPQADEPGIMTGDAIARLRVLLRDGDEEPRATRVLGLEHEYMVYRRGEPVDFRTLIHGLGLPGERVHPIDRHRYLSPTGIALMADGIVAEVAAPPLALGPGFAADLDAWGAHGLDAFAERMPAETRLKGASTHLSVECASEAADEIAWGYAQTFATALMMLLDDAESPGLLIRPRPKRVELGGEFAVGGRLQAAAAMAAGSVIALESAAAGRGEFPVPPPLTATIEPARRRFGWYADRRAYGPDLYSAGRQAILKRSDGKTITAQEHLELSWAAARQALTPHVAPRDLEAADRVVSGEAPLPSEVPIDRSPGTIGAAQLRHPLGEMLAQRLRGAFAVRVVAATWDFGAFAISDGTHEVISSIPRAQLGRFLSLLDAGSLDAVLLAALRTNLSHAVLARFEQTRQAGLWGELKTSGALLPRERVGVGRGQLPRLRIGTRGVSVVAATTGDSALELDTASDAASSPAGTSSLLAGRRERGRSQPTLATNNSCCSNALASRDRLVIRHTRAHQAPPIGHAPARQCRV